MRVVYTLVGIIALALLATGLTEATLAVGRQGRIADDTAIHTTSPTPTPTATPTPISTATPSATPVGISAPAPTPAVPTATTNGFVHLRAGASTATAIVEDLNGGTVVQLGTYKDSQWQQVTVNGVNGYIFRTYLNY